MQIYQQIPQDLLPHHYLILILTVAFIAMHTDIKTRKIPNTLTFPAIAILLTYQLILFEKQQLIPHLQSLAAGTIIFLTAFHLKIFGGGDTKLLIFTSLAFPITLLPSALIWIFTAGGIQSIYYYKKTQKQKKSTKNLQIPYAVSIFTGLLTYILTSTIH